MAKQPVGMQSAGETQQIVINIPCPLVQRVEKYARETGNTLTGVVIEALDAFLLKGPKPKTAL